MPSPYGVLGASDLLAAADPSPAGNPTLRALLAAPPAPGPNGPMPDLSVIQAYLARTGQIYPTLPPVNGPAFAAAVNSWPQSVNIEDRRGLPGAWRR
jgi:hypothetical protein